jgi:hypothetical protein
MNILFIGDIVGRTGRNAVKCVLPELKKQKKIDFVIANGENLAGGFGMTIDSYNEMIDAGIDYFTSGNHIWNKKDFLPYLDDENIKVIRPANYTSDTPGRGFVELSVNNKKIVLINLLGVAFMTEYIANPFLEIDDILSKIKDKESKIIIVDFHAEATSEKVCFGQYLDGVVSAVIGTHTHIATADARVLPLGTAYITDAGMVGALNSSLGDVVAPIINHYKTGLPFKLEVAEGEAIFNAVLIEIDEKTGLSKNIELIQKNVK